MSASSGRACSGAGRAFRLILPCGVKGIEPIRTNADGTMYSGSCSCRRDRSLGTRLRVNLPSNGSFAYLAQDVGRPFVLAREGLSDIKLSSPFWRWQTTSKHAWEFG